MKPHCRTDIPLGTKALVLSKLYYGVLSRQLDGLDIERYFSVLYFLKSNNGCPQQYICNHLAIDKTAMVKVLEYLEERDYVLRTVNPLDRREHLIELTKKGEQKTKEIVLCFDQLDEHLFKEMSEEDQRKFLEVIDLFNRKLSEMPANDLFFTYTTINKSPKHKTFQSKSKS